MQRHVPRPHLQQQQQQLGNAATEHQPQRAVQVAVRGLEAGEEQEEQQQQQQEQQQQEEELEALLVLGAAIHKPLPHNIPGKEHGRGEDCKQCHWREAGMCRRAETPNHSSCIQC